MSLEDCAPLDKVPPVVPMNWGKAIEMLTNLEGGVPNVDGIPDWDEEIGIYDGSGRKIFAYLRDGTVQCADYEDLPEAAVIFFREVVNVARLQGYTVVPLRNSPESKGSEGWDA